MKYEEEKTLEILRKFIEDSYHQHYSSSDKNTQTLDLIMEMPDGLGFLKGSILKYISRFQKKRDNPKADLLKLMHYAILLYYFSFLKEEDKVSEEEHSEVTSNVPNGYVPRAELNPNPYDCVTNIDNSHQMIYNKELTKTNIMYDNVDFNTTNNSIHITKHIKPTKDNNLSYNEQYLDMYDGVPIRTQTTLESSLIDQIYNPNPIEPKVQSSPDWIYDEHKNSLAEQEPVITKIKSCNNSIDEIYAYQNKNRK